MTKVIEKLRQQEQLALDGLMAKERERADAVAAVTKAEDAYHASSTESAEKNWLKAKESEALAELRLKTAQRKLTEATQEREIAERGELERESVKLRGTLDSPDAEEASLVAKEAAFYVEAAKVRVARQANNEARLQLKHRLNEVTRQLTGVETKTWDHEAYTDPPHSSVAEALNKLAHKASQAGQPLLVRYINALALIRFL